MRKTNRVTRALDLLRAALRWQVAHHRPKQADRIRAALAHAQDDLTPPKRLVYPGVAAARHQSVAGGLPGIGGPNPGLGWCLKMVRLCYGIPAVAPDAIGAWNAATKKHRTTNANAIPRGYPVFWSGGSHNHGHIAISAGQGKVWSTDIRRAGFFDVVPIDEIRRAWGLTLLGWTEDLNGQRVPAEREVRG